LEVELYMIKFIKKIKRRVTLYKQLKVPSCENRKLSFHLNRRVVIIFTWNYISIGFIAAPETHYWWRFDSKVNL